MSQQSLCAIQTLLPTLTHCCNSPKEILLSETQRSWTAGCTQRAAPVCSSSMRTPLPRQISGAGDALQRCIENNDNMHSSQHTKAKENKDSPSRERPPEKLRLRHPVLKRPSPGSSSSRASAQRGHDTPAAPARGYTSRFPGWLLPRSHS